MKKLFCLLACVILLACTSETQESQPEVATDQTTHPEQQIAIPDKVVELATLNVSCGCALDDVGKCGNYIEIDSRFVEIANGKELGLGNMEWCNKSGVQVAASGEIKDGKFLAATLTPKAE